MLLTLIDEGGGTTVYSISSFAEGTALRFGFIYVAALM